MCDIYSARAAASSSEAWGAHREAEAKVSESSGRLSNLFVSVPTVGHGR